MQESRAFSQVGGRRASGAAGVPALAIETALRAPDTAAQRSGTTLSSSTIPDPAAAMDTSVAQALTRLARDEMLPIRDARARTIAVFHGMAWLTQEGDPYDHLVVAGETFTLDRDGMALVHALEPTTLFVMDEAEVTPVVVPVAVAHPGVRRVRDVQHIHRVAMRMRRMALRRMWRGLGAWMPSAWAKLSPRRDRVHAMPGLATA